MNINSFDPKNLNHIREHISEALGSVTDRFGLKSIDIGKISYSSSSATFSIKMETDGKADDPIRRSEAFAFGFNPSVFGAELTLKGKKYTVEGFRRTRASVRGEDGRIYTVKVDVIKPRLKDHLLNQQ